uniref:Piezo-type mechanosensitive ion channel component n=1 Tax=Cacopsylla melanoneura TaxID=428564 RepID=A0A8D9ARX6_9HEMI
MSRFLISISLLRIVLPLCLTACICLRHNALTGLYLVLLLYLPLVPAPEPRSMKGHTGFFMKIVVLLSVLMTIAQIAFQIVLLVMSPYGHFLQPWCSSLEETFRYIGFIRYDQLPYLDTVVHMLPEIIMLISSISIQTILDRLNSDESVSNEDSRLLSVLSSSPDPQTMENGPGADRKFFSLHIILGKYLVLFVLCLAGVLRPSIPGAVYYLTFLACATWWATYRDLGKGFAYLCRLLLLPVVTHLVCLYVYQMQWTQTLVPPRGWIARYYGLTPLVETNCTDPRLIHITDVEWPSFAEPLVLVFLYYLLWFESGSLLKLEMELKKEPCSMSRQLSQRLSQKGHQGAGPLFRNKTNRWRVATKKVRIGLIRGRDSLYRRPRSMEEASSSGTTESNVPLGVLNEQDEEDNLPGVSIFEYFMDAVITISRFVTRTSYIATNIIMMAWSIMYHSWLGFILLLWSSLLWMMPNQRQSMLRSSPVLVFYAEFLLVAQYLYGMDLEDSELPYIDADGSDQIGFNKVGHYAFKPLIIKTLFTSMFWITLRQYMQERCESQQNSAVRDLMSPLQISVGAAMGTESKTKGSQLMQQVGETIRNLLTKFWIWVVASMLFFIGISGARMTIFRIIYMALALVFILTFQLSWVIWRKMMYWFWLTVIIYSMLILVMVYTYQFQNFPSYWEDILKIPKTLQLDIGLEKFETTELFVRLLTPTLFVIITVIQLYYFHKDFLTISDIKSRGTSQARMSRPRLNSDGSRLSVEDDSILPSSAAEPEMSDTRQPSVNESLRFSFHFFSQLKSFHMKKAWELFKVYFEQFIELLWLYLELHMIKIILFSIVLISVFDVCAIHMSFIILTVISTTLSSRLQNIIIHITSVTVSILMLLKMIYQIEYIKHGEWNVTCTNSTPGPNKTYNSAEWLGFYKVSDSNTLAHLLSGYIAVIMVVTLNTVVCTRQKYKRHLKGRSLNRPYIMFPRVSYKEVDRDIMHCVKYLFNYAFYRFGVEISFMAVVVLISLRMDFYAMIYAIWLSVMVLLSRGKLAKIWNVFIVFVVIIIPLQYALVVGLPPSLCIHFPWDTDWLQRLRDWMYLPDIDSPPSAYKLICDFFVLLLITRQNLVFRIERRHEGAEYAGGSNHSIIQAAERPNYVNPVPDYISHVKSWLDIAKRVVLQSFLWITLAIVFLAGTNRVNIFSLGYLVGSFIFLWQGNDFYLRPMNVILRWWNSMIGYNVFVILMKTILQIPGCIFMNEIQVHACWLVQLFGIFCIQKFTPSQEIKGDCEVPVEQVGLAWDAVCFMFLILQKRLFSSHYFFHMIDEAKAMAILASRGAELIEELSQKQIQEQQETERRILEKIKYKMDRIKASQKRIHGSGHKEHSSHQKAIRSGDYYMFDDMDDEELDLIMEKTSEDTSPDDELDKDQTVSRLLSNVMKSDIESAISKHKTAKRLSVRTRHSSETSSHRSRRSSLPESKRTPEDDMSGWKSCSSLPEQEDLKPSKKGSASGSKDPIGHDSGGGGDHGDGSGSEEEDEEDKKSDKTSWWHKLMVSLRFAMTFINSVMVTMTRWLNKLSRDYRYVIRTLSMEKKILKNKKGFGVGVRTGASMIWQPLPFSSISQPAITQIQIEELEQKQEQHSSAHPPLARLVLAVWYAVISHSELVCYFMVFVHQIKTATILSLPLPMMVFLWGTLTVPRPTKTFWVTLIAYTEIIVVIKCMFQFEMIPWNQVIVADNQPFFPPRIIGIEKKKDYAMYDLLLLLVVFFHRAMLKSLGLWKSNMDAKKKNNILSLMQKDPRLNPHSNAAEVVTDQTALISVPPHGGVRRRRTQATITLNGAGDEGKEEEKKEEEKKEEEEEKKEREQEENQGDYLLKDKIPVDYLPLLTMFHYLSPVKSFFNQLLTSSTRVTADVYAYMFLCDFFNFMLVIFGFTSFGSQQGDGGVSQYFEENKVPVPFLVMLILQFALIVVDRTLYLRKFILGKIVFQFLLVFGVHAWMFFILPAVTERQFNAAVYPQIWYWVKCVYLLLSAYQIRSGYPTRILGNFLCKNYNYLNKFLFKGFMMVPFVFELRALMDWMWTDTSMTLWDWLKMEDIYAHIFQLKCDRRAEAEYPNPRGQKVSAMSKYFLGGFCMFFLIFVIWFPLVLFALGNTVGKPNLPTDVTIEIRLGPYQPIYSMSAQTGNIRSITENDWDKMSNVYKKSRKAQTFFSNYNFEDVGVVTLSSSSSSLWTISPPEIDTLKENLEDEQFELGINVAWSVSRKTTNPETPGTVKDSNSFYITNETRSQLSQLLFGNASLTQVTIPALLPKFLKVTASTTVAPVSQLMYNTEKPPAEEPVEYMDLTLELSHKPDSEKIETAVQKWWIVHENCTVWTFLDDIPYSTCGTRVNKAVKLSDSLVIYTFNDKAFPETLNLISGKGIIGLYSTFVIIVHTFVRGAFTGISFKIMFDDMPNVDRVLQLCLDIYLVRESGELDLEEDLFAKLVFLYRSPETLVKWTRPPEEIAADEDPESNLPELSN